MDVKRISYKKNYFFITRINMGISSLHLHIFFKFICIHRIMYAYEFKEMTIKEKQFFFLTYSCINK